MVARTLLLLLNLRAAACWAPGGGGGLSYEDRKYWGAQPPGARRDVLQALPPAQRGVGHHEREDGARAPWYPELKAYLRGVKSAAPIEKGEEVVRVRHDALLSRFSMGNSTFRPVAEYYMALGKGPTRRAGEPLQNRAAAAGSAGWHVDPVKAMLAFFVLREGSRSSSRWMPYIKGLLEAHSAENIPLTWAPDSPRHQTISEHLRTMAAAHRRHALTAYRSVMPDALSRFPAVLGEGLPAGGPPLAAVYSLEKWLEVYAMLRARDWILPMYGKSEPFLAPVIDMLNYGQIGIRVRFDNARQEFVATATKAFPAGQEMLFYYGTFCTDDMRDMYGFVTPTAPCRARSAFSKAKARAKGPASRLARTSPALARRAAPGGALRAGPNKQAGRSFGRRSVSGTVSSAIWCATCLGGKRRLTETQAGATQGARTSVHELNFSRRPSGE